MNRNLLIIPLLAAVLVLVFPFVMFYGDHIMVTTTTSMLPVLKPNDMIVVEKSSATQINEGDIIAFDSHMEMGIVAHRAIAIYDNHGELAIDTKGDNNEHEDRWFVTDDSLIGKVKNIVPGFGILLVGPVRYSLVAVIIISSLAILKDHLTEKKNKL
ncbi:MAG: signal peptidase I [Nitrosopumilus sp.]|nr:signal peptidase I [Nitrosopumilus sp.]MCE2507350.1 signal peptidase I [Nitrosopumilaceae archaeon]